VDSNDRSAIGLSLERQQGLNMKYPIVRVITGDHLELHGFLAEAEGERDAILINIHGTSSSFYCEEYARLFAEEFPVLGVTTLFTNNRGSHVMEAWQNSGAALERFEDCRQDLDAWMRYVLDVGYRRIFLQGHSLGTEKIVYYMNHGKLADRVAAVILLGVSDSFGNQARTAKTFPVDPMMEARGLAAAGKGEQFLTSVWRAHGGGVPQNAASYLNFFSPGSELSKTLPLRDNGNLFYYRNIRVPILVLVGEYDPFTCLPVPEALRLLEKENRRTRAKIISGTDHDFSGKEREMVEAVKEFVGAVSGLS
jgi:pimeloyl-ACP methyl ester carboxylesterase